MQNDSLALPRRALPRLAEPRRDYYFFINFLKNALVAKGESYTLGECLVKFFIAKDYHG